MISYAFFMLGVFSRVAEMLFHLASNLVRTSANTTSGKGLASITVSVEGEAETSSSAFPLVWVYDYCIKLTEGTPYNSSSSSSSSSNRPAPELWLHSRLLPSDSSCQMRDQDDYLNRTSGASGARAPGLSPTSHVKSFQLDDLELSDDIILTACDTDPDFSLEMDSSFSVDAPGSKAKPLPHPQPHPLPHKDVSHKEIGQTNRGTLLCPPPRIEIYTAHGVVASSAFGCSQHPPSISDMYDTPFATPCSSHMSAASDSLTAGSAAEFFDALSPRSENSSGPDAFPQQGRDSRESLAAGVDNNNNNNDNNDNNMEDVLRGGDAALSESEVSSRTGASEERRRKRRGGMFGLFRRRGPEAVRVEAA